jgi:serine/threonine protein phosphatase PrpC
MAPHSPDPVPPAPGDGLPPTPPTPSPTPESAEAAKEEEELLLPEWDVPLEQVAAPIAAPVATPAEEQAEPQVETEAIALPQAIADWVPMAEPVLAPAEPEAPPAEVEAPPPRTILCPVCQSPRQGEETSCADCGYYFSEADLAGGAAASSADPAPTWLQDRFELGVRLSSRFGVDRFRGLDHGDKSSPPVPIVVLRQELPRPAEPMPMAEPVADDEEILPGFDDLPFPTASPTNPHTEKLPNVPSWPSVTWERNLIDTVGAPAVPAEVAYFTDDRYEYLVEEVPQGQGLWDAWDDPEATWDKRFGLLVQVAETLHLLHNSRAILEGLRPEHVVVTPEGQARLNDLSDLLPLPLPADVPVKGTLYTAPELTSGQGRADARADLYSFGGMLYSLHVGRELTEMDFERPGQPKPFVPRYPDIHPAFGRLMMKTFRKEPDLRFPSDEAGKEDATGFLELIRTLQVLRRTMDTVRMEVASWTTTGMVRTGNEDAFALLHSCESRQDDLNEAVLILLCDGMGGYEAGEVAAALAIQCLRQNLLSQKPFQHLAGAPAFATDPLGNWNHPDGHNRPPLNPDVGKQLLKAALKDANKQVFAASRVPGSKRRGMGCTAEVVFVNGRHLIVGHVGDSRTYHLHEGRLIQLTRDQTLVNRLVELGTLSQEEAETHPRRNELQQAVGGQPDVEPGVYVGELKPGDWVLVCSDGLTNHVNAKDLESMLMQEAWSAETAARRLVNLVNIEGATDNATVVVIRCT